MHETEKTPAAPTLRTINIRKAGTIRPTAAACYCYGCCCCVRPY